jgi:hypothetical protein
MRYIGVESTIYGVRRVFYLHIGVFLLCKAGGEIRVLRPFIERASVAFDAGLEFRELAVGRALGSAGHLSAFGELRESLADPEGFRGVTAAFVEGG